jgi:sarcosine oxidase delta subunit
MTIKGCPFCLRTDAVEFRAEEDAYVTVVVKGEEGSEEAGPNAVYRFGCCGRAVVLLAEE